MKTKEQKRKEAAERAAAKRTPAEQLAHLDRSHFKATKERAKLRKQMEATQ